MILPFIPFGLFELHSITLLLTLIFTAIACIFLGAGFAGANPFKAGNTAFRLAAAKALVPFVFLYSPAMLIVVDGFTWQAFVTTVVGCAVGIVFIGASLTGFFLTRMTMIERLVTFVASPLIVAPGLKSGTAGLMLMISILVSQLSLLQNSFHQ